MTKKKKLIFLGLGATVLASGLAGFLYWRAHHAPPTKEELHFRQQIVFRAGALSIDNRPFSKMPCTGAHQEPEPFTFFKTKDEREIDILCSESYMGGVSISYLESHSMPKSLTLAISENDSGVYWDTRSWLRYNKEKDELSIQVVSLSSSPATASSSTTDTLCAENQSVYLWNKKSQEFEQLQLPEPLEIPEFAPPISVANECLTPFGRWSGDNTQGR